MTIDLEKTFWTEFVLSEHYKWRFRAPRFQNFPQTPLVAGPFSARLIRR